MPTVSHAVQSHFQRHVLSPAVAYHLACCAIASPTVCAQSCCCLPSFTLLRIHHHAVLLSLKPCLLSPAVAYHPPPHCALAFSMVFAESCRCLPSTVTHSTLSAESCHYLPPTTTLSSGIDLPPPCSYLGPEKLGRSNSITRYPK